VRLKRILVPVDFSPCSQRALAYARQLAKSFDAELLLLHIVEPAYRADAADVYVATPQGSALLAEHVRLAREQLRRLATDLANGGCGVRSMVKRGAPAQAITQVAGRVRAQLIVMGTYGRTGLSHLLMGSVAERVVRSAPCPVLTVRRPPPVQRTSTRARQAGG
jgi:universal stress protein A